MCGVGAAVSATKHLLLSKCCVFLISFKCLVFCSFTAENGIKAQEQGEVKNKGTDNEIQSVRGSYSYTGPDGVLYEVTYIADENGFQPMVRTKSYFQSSIFSCGCAQLSNLDFYFAGRSYTHTFASCSTGYCSTTSCRMLQTFNKKT